MARKKNSKKDLERRVEKLKKKVATLNAGLNKKKSELSRSLSTVQKKLDKVRKQNGKFRKESSRFSKQSAKLSRQGSKLDKQNSKLGKQTTKLDKQTTKLDKQHSKLDKRTNRLDKRHSKLDKQTSSLDKRHSKLDKQTNRLDKRQSKLDKQHSKLTKQTAKLSKQTAKFKEFASQGERFAELQQQTEGLAARLQDVEHTVANVERAGDDIQERTRRLETSLAEAANQGPGMARLLDDPDAGLEHSIAVLRERTQSLEDQLGRLHTAQEGLELQIALLSREAEEGGETPTTGVAVTTAAAPAANGEVLQQLPVLRAGLGHAEEQTEKLGQRTALLEDAQTALSEQDDRLAAQLQELEQRVADLGAQLEQSTGTPVSAALEEQVALLSTDRSRDQSRIEDILSKADELEKTKLNYTRHTDALADRVSVISDRIDALLALEPERRLDELERQGGALERSLSGDRERLDALDDSEQTLGQQLLGAIDDVTSIDDRVLALGKTDEQLGDEIDSLRVALREADEQARQHHERLQTQEVRLEEQRQRLDDAIEGQKKATEGLAARLATLEESRQTLQEAADGLRVQQVRQDHDTGNLKKSLQQRSLIGLGLILAAGVLGFVMPRGGDREATQELQALMQAVETADKEATVLIAGLEKEMGILRREVLALSKSVAGLSRTVEEITAEGETAADAGETANLAQAVEQLTQQVQASGEETQALRVAGDEQRLETAALKEMQEVQRQETAELKQGQEQLQSEVEKMSTEVKALSEAAAGSVGSVSGDRADAWAQAQQAGRYTIQLVGTHGHGSLNGFLAQHELGTEGAVFNTTHQGRPWHVVFYGIYPSVEKAVEARKGLPAGLTAAGPWVRRLPKSGAIHPR